MIEDLTVLFYKGLCYIFSALLGWYLDDMINWVNHTVGSNKEAEG